MTTPLCRELGIELPVFAFSRSREVVAEVSRHGGLGVLGATQHDPDRLDSELDWIEKRVGGAPYGVDVMLPARHAMRGADAAAVDDLHARIPPSLRRFVDDLLERFGVPELDGEAGMEWSGVGRRITEAGSEELLDVTFAHRPRLVASALGPPPPAMVERARDAGMLVAGLAGTVTHAQQQARAGADIIVAQGTEAAGHTGTIGTMTLVPEVVEAMAPLPVLAAGGIVTGRQVAASLVLGAQGAWMGSVWLTSDEGEPHDALKDALLEAQSTDTVRSRCLTGKPARQLRSAWTEAWEQPDSPDPLPMPLQIVLLEDAHERIERAIRQGHPGARQLMHYPVGQGVGMMCERRSVAQIMARIADELHTALRDPVS
jgi:NAD(P)H-dependent flavin oxidoreductase YrpB (nitropropane dioxygenase family)